MNQNILTNKNFRFLSNWNPDQENGYTPKVVVVTAFLQKDDKILVLQRARNDEQHGLWGIPGGKLEDQELPLCGLIREIQEETGLSVSSEAFVLLNTAISKTPCDGEYGLYLYHAFLSEDQTVRINLQEHHAYRWVTLSEFQELDLLTAQREAFLFAKENLQKIMSSKSKELNQGCLCTIM